MSQATHTTYDTADQQRSRRDILLPLSGLLLGMFVAILAGTVVSTSLPKIIAELDGTQAAFTWVVTATLLTTAVSTPIWGKLADLFNRKFLVQLSLTIFTLGTVLAGFSQDTGTLIGLRALQGIGAGGLTALVQIVMADLISPRERGRYMGLFGAVMAVGTVGGPLLGGFITDIWSWRGNFFVAVPFAVAAVILLQKTLKVPARPKRKVSIDYLGASFLATGVSLLLIWVTLAGNSFDWVSPASGWMLSVSLVLIIALIITEAKTKEPIIPLSLFKNRTFTLAVLASISVGVAMFGTSVFLSQYMQLARGATPTQSGLMTLPMVLALMVSSTVVGGLVSRRGVWKRYLICGSISLTVGLALLGTIKYDTPFVLVSIYMFLLGAGVGMVMQNLVLVVQNDSLPQQIGVASSGVAFFRSLGGTVGVSALGAVLGTQVAGGMAENAKDIAAALSKAGPAGADALAALNSGVLPTLSALPDAARQIVESIYGLSVGHLFLVAAPLGLLTILAVSFLPNKPLSNMTTGQRMAQQAEAKSNGGSNSAEVRPAAQREVVGLGGKAG